MYVHFKVTVSIFILVPKYELTTLFDSNTSSCPSIDGLLSPFIEDVPFMEEEEE